MFDELWSEIQDAPGEIFDIIEDINAHNEFKKKDFNFDEYLNSNIDYWIMTSISLTSGEILDIIANLDDLAENLEEAENYTLSAYYLNIIQQFQSVYDKLQDFVPENRVANLVLSVN
jgi:uncharacterized protein YjgD (DUF1641 family)